MHFLAGAGIMAAISLLLVASFTSIGIAVAGKVLRGFSNPLFFPLAVAFGIPVYGAIGLAVVLLPVDKQLSAAILLLFVNVAALIVNAKSWPQWKPAMASAKWPLALWIGSSLLCGLVTFYPARIPDKLIDGPYIFKKDTLYVRMQALVGNYPVDNVLPDVVVEYLMRGISFKTEHPIIPGQEVSDRPILMPLVTVPVRALLGPVEDGPKTLPRFTYYDVQWPDVAVILSNTTFRQFLDVAIPLNATIIIAFWYLGRFVGIGRILPLASVVLVLLSPYVMKHTIFTWPKNLGAMYIVLGMLVMNYRQSPWLAGLLLGFAYWAHPQGIIFAGALGLYYLVEYFRKREPFADAAYFGIAFGLVAAPWLVWTRLVLHIPSDIFEQNFIRHYSLIEHVWWRFYNLTYLLFPVSFSAPAFVPVPFAYTMTITLAGMIGLPFFMPAIYAVFYYIKQYKNMTLYGVVIPSLVILGIFSIPDEMSKYGWQAMTIILLALSLKFLQERIPAKVLVALILLQGIVNIGILEIYAHEHLPRCPGNLTKCSLPERLNGNAL